MKKLSTSLLWTSNTEYFIFFLSGFWIMHEGESNKRLLITKCLVSDVAVAVIAAIGTFWQTKDLNSDNSPYFERKTEVSSFEGPLKIYKT